MVLTTGTSYIQRIASLLPLADAVEIHGVHVVTEAARMGSNAWDKLRQDIGDAGEVSVFAAPARTRYGRHLR